MTDATLDSVQNRALSGIFLKKFLLFAFTCLCGVFSLHAQESTPSPVIVHDGAPKPVGLPSSAPRERGKRLDVSGAETLPPSAQDTGTGEAPVAATNALVIRSIFPVVTRVSHESKTADPMLVEYEVVNGSEALTNGQLELDEGIKAAFKLPISALAPGVHQVTLPSGIPLSAALTGIRVSVAKPDGTYSSVTVDVHASMCGDTGAQLAQVTPKYAFEGSADLTVTLTGSRLGSLKRVFVRQSGGAWQGLTASRISSTEATVTIPAALLSNSGFLQLSPNSEEQFSLAFLVASRSLPARKRLSSRPRPGSRIPDFTIDQVVPENIGPSDGTLTVTGTNFKQGMQVVLGLSSGPAIVLPSWFLSETSLSAALPSYIGRAENLAVHVLSADGTETSSSFDVSSGQPSNAPENEPAHESVVRAANPAETIPDGAVALTEILTPLVPYCADEPDTSDMSVQLRGVNLTDGMPVVFQAISGDFSKEIARVPLEDVSATPAPLPFDARDVAARNLITNGSVTIPRRILGIMRAGIVIKAKGKSSGKVTATMWAIETE